MRNCIVTLCDAVTLCLPGKSKQIDLNGRTKLSKETNDLFREYKHVMGKFVKYILRMVSTIRALELRTFHAIFVCFTDCEDVEENCATWAWQESCQVLKEYMQENCKKSCNVSSKSFFFS